MRESIPEFLRSNELFYFGMIETIRRGRARVIHQGSGGVLLRETSSGAYMLAAGDDETALGMLDTVRDADLLVTHRLSLLPELERRFGLKPEPVCRLAAWPRTEALPEPETPFQIRALALPEAGEAARVYASGGPGYIESRAAAGEMLGAFDGDRLAGFIGLHDEGSMGLLEVLPEYRGRGLGAALLARLSNILLQKGWAPYSHFFQTNTVSERLHRKLGFAVSAELLCWVSR